MKIHNYFKATLLIVFASLIYGCNSEKLPEKSGAKEAWIENSRAQSSSLGLIKVQTNNNAPVAGVSIMKSGVIIGETNNDGVISLHSLRVREGDVLNFEHDSYVTVTKIVTSAPGMLVVFKKRASAVRISSRRATQLRLASGGSITVPKFAFSSRGRPYTGDVSIRATYIDVTDNFDLLSAPGNYIAQDPNRPRDLRPLTSYGMIEINAMIPNTNVMLDLIQEKPIKIELPILNPVTPSSVNLYEFNEDTGYWNLESVLTNTGNTLVGEVTSIDSAWNADEPCAEELICVTVQVEYTDYDPGCYIYATGETYAGTDGGYPLNADGVVEFQVCPNSVFTLGSCLVLCCDGQPENEFCCDNPYAYTTTIDLSAITINPDGCTDLGVWVIEN